MLADISNPTGDVWLKFDEESDEEPAYEGNTYHDDGLIRADWYHTGVGLISSRTFATYRKAEKWLEAEGFINYSSTPVNTTA